MTHSPKEILTSVAFETEFKLSHETSQYKLKIHEILMQMSVFCFERVCFNCQRLGPLSID